MERFRLGRGLSHGSKIFRSCSSVGLHPTPVCPGPVFVNKVPNYNYLIIKIPRDSIMN